MFKCTICDYVTDDQSKFGGHVSGHVRAGEMTKKYGEYKPASRMCQICDLSFDSAHKRWGHDRLMHSDFNSIRTDARRKARLICERGRRCEVCENNEWMKKPIPIELDHIDGNPENNLIENLRLICPNCHAQTDTYKGKNVGRVQNSKRQITMQRYVGKYR